MLREHLQLVNKFTLRNDKKIAERNLKVKWKLVGYLQLKMFLVKKAFFKEKQFQINCDFLIQKLCTKKIVQRLKKNQIKQTARC